MGNFLFCLLTKLGFMYHVHGKNHESVDRGDERLLYTTSRSCCPNIVRCRITSCLGNTRQLRTEFPHLQKVPLVEYISRFSLFGGRYGDSTFQNPQSNQHPRHPRNLAELFKNGSRCSSIYMHVNGQFCIQLHIQI